MYPSKEDLDSLKTHAFGWIEDDITDEDYHITGELEVSIDDEGMARSLERPYVLYWKVHGDYKHSFLTLGIKYDDELAAMGDDADDVPHLIFEKYDEPTGDAFFSIKNDVVIFKGSRLPEFLNLALQEGVARTAGVAVPEGIVEELNIV